MLDLPLLTMLPATHFPTMSMGNMYYGRLPTVNGSRPGVT